MLPPHCHTAHDMIRYNKGTTRALWDRGCVAAFPHPSNTPHGCLSNTARPHNPSTTARPIFCSLSPQQARQSTTTTTTSSHVQHTTRAPAPRPSAAAPHTATVQRAAGGGNPTTGAVTLQPPVTQHTTQHMTLPTQPLLLPTCATKPLTTQVSPLECRPLV